MAGVHQRAQEGGEAAVLQDTQRKLLPGTESLRRWLGPLVRKVCHVR